MNTLKKEVNRHYYSIIIFAFILLYNCIIFKGFAAWEMHGVAYTLHLVDYSFGFCTKFLPGAIYNFFFDSYAKSTVIIFEAVLFCVFTFICALLLERFILQCENTQKNTACFLVFMFITGTSTFTMQLFMLGSLDTYWVYFYIIFLLLIQNKKTYFLIVPLSALMIINHYTALVVFIPFMLVLMLYKVSSAKNTSEKICLYTVMALSAIVAAGFTFYFTVFESGNLTYTFNEFLSELKNRSDFYDASYLATSLYDYDLYNLFDQEFFDKIDSPVLYALAQIGYRIKTTFAMRPLSQGVVPFLLNLPVVYLFYAYIKEKKAAEKSDKLKIFSFYLIWLAYFGIILLTLFLSTDTGRFVGHSYTLLCASFFFIFYNEKDNALQIIENKLKKVPKGLLALYCACYMFLIFAPYT